VFSVRFPKKYILSGNFLLSVEDFHVIDFLSQGSSSERFVVCE